MLESCEGCGDLIQITQAGLCRVCVGQLVEQPALIQIEIVESILAI